MLAVPLVALLAVAGSRLAGIGAGEGPSTAAPLARLDAGEPGAGSEAAAALVVHVVGAVHRPGLFHLKDGSRVADAVARAGGPTRRADLSAVNLAAPLADGQPTPGNCGCWVVGPGVFLGHAASNRIEHATTLRIAQDGRLAPARDQPLRTLITRHES